MRKALGMRQVCHIKESSQSTDKDELQCCPPHLRSASPNLLGHRAIAADGPHWSERNASMLGQE